VVIANKAVCTVKQEAVLFNSCHFLFKITHQIGFCLVTRKQDKIKI